MAGKENLPKPPQLAHAFAYALLTLYHSLPRLSIASREKFRAPSAAYFSVSLSLARCSATITSPTNGGTKAVILSGKPTKRSLLYNCGIYTTL